MKLAILNSKIVTNPGTYKLQEFSVKQAQHLMYSVMNQQDIADGIESYIGHASTASLLSTVLKAEIPVNRGTFAQEVGQDALIITLPQGVRLEEGRVLSLEEITAIGFTLFLLTRTA